MRGEGSGNLVWGQYMLRGSVGCAEFIGELFVGVEGFYGEGVLFILGGLQIDGFRTVVDGQFFGQVRVIGYKCDERWVIFNFIVYFLQSSSIQRFYLRLIFVVFFSICSIWRGVGRFCLLIFYRVQWQLERTVNRVEGTRGREGQGQVAGQLVREGGI